MERINYITAEQLRIIGEKDETAMVALDYLPCGAWAGAYWEDINGRRYAACAAFTCQFRYGTQSEIWHADHTEFTSTREATWAPAVK